MTGSNPSIAGRNPNHETGSGAVRSPGSNSHARAFMSATIAASSARSKPTLLRLCPGNGESDTLSPLPPCVDKRQLTFYTRTVIERFKHKGLRNLFQQDDFRRVGADQVDRLRLILSALDQAGEVQDMNQPTFRLHPLKGNRGLPLGGTTQCR